MMTPQTLTIRDARPSVRAALKSLLSADDVDANERQNAMNPMIGLQHQNTKQDRTK